MKRFLLLSVYLSFSSIIALGQGVEKEDNVFNSGHLHLTMEIPTHPLPAPDELVPLDSIVIAKWTHILDKMSSLDKLKANGLISKSMLIERKSELFEEIQRLIAMRAITTRRRWQ